MQNRETVFDFVGMNTLKISDVQIWVIVDSEKDFEYTPWRIPEPGIAHEFHFF